MHACWWKRSADIRSIDYICLAEESTFFNVQHKLVTKTPSNSVKQKSVCLPGVLPYMGDIDKVGPNGYGFSAVLVSILTYFGHFG